jgi:hypothetical protein
MFNSIRQEFNGELVLMPENKLNMESNVTDEYVVSAFTIYL